MQFSKLIHYAKKVVQLGPVESWRVFQNRLLKKKSYQKLKSLALSGRVHHRWEQIAHKHNIKQSFIEFFKTRSKKIVIFFPEKILEPLAKDTSIQKKADEFVGKCFDLLGSGPVQFQTILWHTDFRLHKQNKSADCSFDQNVFYQDMQIQSGPGDTFVKDIKLPWELSRCYHFAVLGQAYAQTKDKKYADAFACHLSDWIEKNPYLLGPNWVCPMEVGIRAINWLAGFYYFKNTEPFFLICSLYDHFVYLENNWEIYDSRTSNHYLSDLVGYFFLCFFFDDLSGIEEKKRWCFHEILKEFEKQVFDEGTDYEGSTAYHRLVTELFYLFFELCKKNNLPLPQTFEKKLSRMFGFIDWCTPHGGNLIEIGDDDSGRILYHGVTSEVVAKFAPQENKKIKHFTEFGLSVIKTKTWHVALRHHAYNKRQPSGHFHNDVGSVTLSVDGIPIFVDPGSFVYTPSAVWRNRFRSAAVHNSFYLKGIEPVPLNDQLFFLHLPEKKINLDQENFVLNVQHNLYKRFGLHAQRSVALDEQKNMLTISDAWCSEKEVVGFTSCWNFTLSSDIDPIIQDGVWKFFYKQKHILSMQSDDLVFDCYDSWVSLGYGTKVPTKCLRAKVPIELNQRFLIKIF